MSYKFQRLREKIRQAVASGELSGKLPGERELARRFHVNAKTLSKALTDLAAEGLLQRSIGRGTFVKGSGPDAASQQGPWLVVCDLGESNSALVQLLRRENPELQTIEGVASVRPSFLCQFCTVVDLAADTPEAFLKDLVVRNMPLVVVGREPRTYSTHAVLVDVPYAAWSLGRDLMLAGHRRLVAVEGRGRTAVASALRAAAARYAPHASVDTCFPKEVGCAIENGVTAAVCDSAFAARETAQSLARASFPVPGAVSIAAVGRATGNCPCSGYFVSPEQECEAIVDLLRHGMNGKPTALWLNGRYVDRGTLSPTVRAIDSEVIRQPVPQFAALIL